jgi:anthranilate phosphoribosyltransferase
MTPGEFGIDQGDVSQLAVDDAQQSLVMIRKVFANEPGPARDIVLLNAGAAIYTAGLADNVASGIEKAKAVLANGEAANKFDALVDLSKQL